MANFIFNKTGNKMMSLSKDDAGKIVTFRSIIYIIIAFISASTFDYVKAEAMREFNFHQNVLPIIGYVSGGLLVLSLAYLVITVVKKIDTSAHYVTPAMLSAIFAYVLGTVLLYDKFRVAPTFFYAFTAIACVLVILYYVYIVLFYKN